MKVSELIKELYAAEREHGDIEIRTYAPGDKIKPISGVTRGMSFDGENFLVLDFKINWPSKTGNPSGGGRDNA